MKIRPAEARDLPSIVAMLSDDALGSTREDFRIPLPESYQRAFGEIDSDPRQELMVVENEHAEIVGTFQFTLIPYLTYRGGMRAQVEAVRVRKDHRGKGLGRAMFNWIINRAEDSGAHVLQLTTDKRRPDSLNFYKSLGFEASHEGLKMHFHR